MKPYRTRFTQILGILTLSVHLFFYINKKFFFNLQMSELSTWIQAFNEGSNFTLKKKLKDIFFKFWSRQELQRPLKRTHLLIIFRTQICVFRSLRVKYTFFVVKFPLYFKNRLIRYLYYIENVKRLTIIITTEARADLVIKIDVWRKF